MPKQRWITFGNTGGRVIKGDEPQGEHIKAPIVLPNHIPMHYWKLDNGIIVEMNDEEKKISDENTSKIKQVYEKIEAKVEPVIEKIIEKVEVQVINHIPFNNKENENKLSELHDKIKAIKDNICSDLVNETVRIDNNIHSLVKDIDKAKANTSSEIHDLELSINNLEKIVHSRIDVVFGHMKEAKNESEQKLKDLISVKDLENIHLELMDIKNEIHKFKAKHIGLWLNNKIIGTLVLINFILWLIRYL